MYKQNETSIININKGTESRPMEELENYVDRCLIDEYAIKSFEDGYYLDVETIPENERLTLVEKMIKEDTGLRDQVLHYMQELINKRLQVVELEDRSDMGFSVRQDDGDVYLMRYI